jgi:hypothetical protein
MRPSHHFKRYHFFSDMFTFLGSNIYPIFFPIQFSIYARQRFDQTPKSIFSISSQGPLLAFTTFRGSGTLAGVNKCPYCLQYWREESLIFIKFGKVFWWCEAPLEILPKFPSITFGEEFLVVENTKISSPIIKKKYHRFPKFLPKIFLQLHLGKNLWWWKILKSLPLLLLKIPQITRNPSQISSPNVPSITSGKKFWWWKFIKSLKKNTTDIPP